jgi:GntR family transcriptional regulator
MQELELEGKIIRYRGRGTFIARPKASHSPDHYPTLSDHLLNQGITPGWKVLSSGWLSPASEIASLLQIESTTAVFCLCRLRLENTEPIGYHIAYVAPDFADSIDENLFTEGGSLRYLRNQDLLKSSTANRILEAVPASQEEADYLDVERGAPMLLIRRLVVSADGKPIEVFRGLYRGDRFEYHITNMRAISTINA